MDAFTKEIFILMGQIGQLARAHLVSFTLRHNRRSCIVTSVDKDTTEFERRVLRFCLDNSGRKLGCSNTVVRFEFSNGVTLYGQREFVVKWSADGVVDAESNAALAALRPVASNAHTSPADASHAGPGMLVKVLLYVLFLLIGCMLLFIVDFMFHLRF